MWVDAVQYVMVCSGVLQSLFATRRFPFPETEIEPDVVVSVVREWKEGLPFQQQKCLVCL